MKSYFPDVESQLKEAIERYDCVITCTKFNYGAWKERVALLSPIVASLQSYAEEKKKFCDQEKTLKQKQQKELIERRIYLYDSLTKYKCQLSDLDIERMKIGEEINIRRKEIETIEVEMENLQKSMAQAKKDKEYWDTVFWATCWLPFVNIGTGIKKEGEKEKYRMKIKFGEENRRRKETEIEKLADELKEIEKEQKQNHETSGELANQITKLEGQISGVTGSLNRIRREFALWYNIYTACEEIDTELAYTNGKIEKVLECFYRLKELQNLLYIPITDRFIQGCIYKGDRLKVGERLNQNEYLLSPNRYFALVMQADNNLVIYRTDRAIWSTNTWGAKGNGFIEISSDGMVNLKGTDRCWNAKRPGAAVLIMQDDGNLVTYDQKEQPLWASDTYMYAKAGEICFSINQ